MTRTLHSGTSWGNRSPEYRANSNAAAKAAREVSNYGRGQTNREFASTSQAFQDACVLAGVNPTKRQASKYRRGQGSAAKVK